MLVIPYLNSSPPKSPPQSPPRPLGRRFGRRWEEKGNPDLYTTMPKLSEKTNLGIIKIQIGSLTLLVINISYHRLINSYKFNLL